MRWIIYIVIVSVAWYAHERCVKNLEYEAAIDLLEQRTLLTDQCTEELSETSTELRKQIDRADRYEGVIDNIILTR